MENSAYLALPLFAGLPPAELPRALAALDARRRTFVKGEVLLEAGQHARSVKIVKQLAAEFKVQLAAEMRDALLDVRRLGCNVLFVVKTDFFHVPFIPP